MRTKSFQAARLGELFRRFKIATMPELKEALGTDVDVTVFRKLEIGYRSSIRIEEDTTPERDHALQ